MSSETDNRRIVLGRISGVYGVRGWVKVFSETEPRDGILNYSPWLLSGSDTPHQVVEGRAHGKGVVARLAGCEDRDQAAALVEQEISITRGRLPPPRPDEFYWADLEGLAVWTAEGPTGAGMHLGQVDHLFSTGANDVLVVVGDRERLLPFAWDDVIKSVDFDQGRILVDWDPDF